MQGAQANLRNVRISCVFGFNRKSPIFNLKAGYVRCATCVITRGVSYIRVFRWAFGDASIKTWIFRHTTFSFFAPTGWCHERRRRKGGEGKQLKQLMRTTFRGMRANPPAHGGSAAELGRGRKSCFYSCSGCCQ